MPNPQQRLILGATTLVVFVLLLWSCAVSGGETEGTEGDPTTSESTEPTGLPDAPPIVPITGGTTDDGQPEPPPVHAVFSVVVRGETSWYPYAGPELNGLDTDAAQAIAHRLRQIDEVLASGDIPASIEMAYGPAAALCATAPELFDHLEANGHTIGMHARSHGEAFRVQSALDACDRVATTASGLASMSDPHGPEEASLESLTASLAILSVLDLHQVVGRISPVCTNLGLAAPTHGYGTGAFTAPWRSGWTVDEPCSDLRRGRIVMIDQTSLAPGEGASRLDGGAWSNLRARTDQMLAYALDLRYAEAGDLPAPGIITWGVTVRLDDLIAPDPPQTEDSSDEADGDEGDEQDEPPVTIDVRTAPLGDESLAELGAMIGEKWAPSMESGRLVWMAPDEIGLLMRPLDLTDS